MSARIETSSMRHRLVRDEQPRLEGEGGGDDDPLALPAGQLERVAVLVHLRRGQPGLGECRADAGPLVLLVAATWWTRSGSAMMSRIRIRGFSDS